MHQHTTAKKLIFCASQPKKKKMGILFLTKFSVLSFAFFFLGCSAHIVKRTDICLSLDDNLLRNALFWNIFHSWALWYCSLFKMLVLFGIWDDGFDALLCNCVFWTFLPFNIKWNNENTSRFQSEEQIISNELLSTLCHVRYNY